MKIFKNLILGLVFFCIMFAITGCVDKTALTSKQFKSKMESMDYIVQDATEQKSEYDYIKKIYVAADNDISYQIEFFDLKSNEYATSFFNDNKEIFEESKAENNTEKFVRGKNYDKYNLTTNDKFKVVSRIGNTVIYLNVDKKYKDEVKDILKELGY